MSKVPIQEAIPKGFAAFMKDAANLIEAGDDATTMESDDLLQVRGTCFCYGGLVDANAEMFAFCYFPKQDLPEEEPVPEWEIYITKAQIQEVASGKLTELALWRCADQQCESRFSSAKSYCPHCDKR
jgi:hypothetical protein